MLAQKRKIDDTEGDDHQNGSNGTMVDNGNMKLPHVAGVLRVCDELRTDLQTRKRIRSQDEAPESKQRTVVPMETSLRFLELLQLQRAAYTHTRSTKQVTSEEKLSMDKLNLDYQNVIYEIRHLEKEIAACEDIETEYQKIELISEEEFEKAHPEAPTDPHAKMLARLNHELEERESLVKQGEELTKELNEAKDENDTALQELETLDAELSEALKSTIPLQKRLGVRATAKREQLERAKLLPDPLFVLYKTSIGYMEAMDNTDMEVDIIGDAELAVDFTSRTPLAPVADQKPSSADEMEVDQPADNEGAGSKDHADHSSTLYRRHPLSIQWSLKDGLSQDAVAKVSFSYLTSLEIVVVSTEVLQTLEHIPGTLLGMGIMAGDTGTDSPNPSNAYQQSA
ncbi:Fms-interacting protein-domain-containing protein [Gaertneriomyces semiglobifer]|nr:Fms-interacting protein-domain-containing protein [Gaertneriomyces semiglobifer]